MLMMNSDIEAVYSDNLTTSLPFQDILDTRILVSDDNGWPLNSTVETYDG